MAKTATKSDKVIAHAVWDADAQQLALVFPNGTQAEQKADAETHMNGLLGRRGESPERDLSVVKIIEA